MKRKLKAGWVLLWNQPAVIRLQKRFARQIQFFKARFSPGTYLGLHLTVGATLLIAAAWLFGAIAEDVATADPLTQIDRRVATWFHIHARKGLDETMSIITDAASPAVIGGLMFLISILLIWRRRWYPSLTLILSVGGGTVLNVLLKSAFHRRRPSFVDAVQALTDYSFPSGHTMAATLFYGTLTVLVLPRLRRWRWRVVVVLVAGAVILLVALSRIYLGAHYPSDVMGAMTAGLAWLALCHTGVDTARRRGLRLSSSRI